MQCARVPQWFYRKSGNDFGMVVVKIVVGILFGGAKTVRTRFAPKLRFPYKLRAVPHNPGLFLYFGLKIEQCQEINSTLSCEGKSKYLSSSVISRLPWIDEDEALTKLETHFFSSVTGSLGFIDQIALPTATFFNSYLQQKKKETKFYHVLTQNSFLKQLKQFGAVCQYCSVQGQGTSCLYVVYFADAACPCGHGELVCIDGLDIGEPI